MAKSGTIGRAFAHNAHTRKGIGLNLHHAHEHTLVGVIEGLNLTSHAHERKLTMKKFILALIATLALLFALGSVGAYDNGSIGFWQLILQFGISTLVAWIALRNAK